MARAGRKHPVIAHADPKRVSTGGEFNGVPAVASFQMHPISDRPYVVRGIKVGESDRIVEFCLTEREAMKLAHDFLGFKEQAHG